jgi:spoIIIJ-associated protein
MAHEPEDTMPAEPMHAEPMQAEPMEAEPMHAEPMRSEPRSVPAEAVMASGGGSRSSEPMLSGDALAAEGKRWTEQMLKAMGFDATIRATADGDRVNVIATVERDEQLLTGEKGEVRQALQQLLNRMINRGETSRYHLQLEINDFWDKRERELEELARRLAEEAVTSDAEVVTDYLNAQERRIIHVTLRDDTRVKTYSVGTGHIKRLAVAPAGHPGGSESES